MKQGLHATGPAILALALATSGLGQSVLTPALRGYWLIVPGVKDAPDRVLKVAVTLEIGKWLRAGEDAVTVKASRVRLDTQAFRSQIASVHTPDLAALTPTALADARSRFTAKDHWMETPLPNGDVVFVRGANVGELQAFQIELQWGTPSTPELCFDSPTIVRAPCGCRRPIADEGPARTARLAEQEMSVYEKSFSEVVAERAAAADSSPVDARAKWDLGMALLASSSDRGRGLSLITTACLAEPSLIGRIEAGVPGLTDERLRSASNFAAQRATKSGLAADWIAVAAVQGARAKSMAAAKAVEKAIACGGLETGVATELSAVARRLSSQGQAAR